MFLGLVLFVHSSTQAASKQAYGSACTPLVNPYTGFSPVSSPLVGCGQCVFTSECTALKGLSVPSTDGMSTGCELLPDVNIQVRQSWRVRARATLGCLARRRRLPGTSRACVRASGCLRRRVVL